MVLLLCNCYLCIHFINQIPNQLIKSNQNYTKEICSCFECTLTTLFCWLHSFCPSLYPSTCYPNTSARPNKRSKLLHSFQYPLTKKKEKNRFRLVSMSSHSCMFLCFFWQTKERRLPKKQQQQLRKSQSDNSRARLQLKDACQVSGLSFFFLAQLLSLHIFACWANIWIFV